MNLTTLFCCDNNIYMSTMKVSCTTAADYANLSDNKLEIIDLETGKKADNIDLAYIASDDKLIANIYNCDTENEKELQIKYNDGKVKNVVNMLNETVGTDAVTLKPYEAVLLSFEPDKTTDYINLDLIMTQGGAVVKATNVSDKTRFANIVLSDKENDGEKSTFGFTIKPEKIKTVRFGTVSEKDNFVIYAIDENNNTISNNIVYKPKDSE